MSDPARPTSVIVAGARTPIGRLLGGLKGQSAADLGGVAIQGALAKAGVSGEQVDYVIMGQVIQAGAGQITARQAAVKAGIPMTVPSITINKVCLSGINAIALADQLIRAGEHDVVVAGGMESMTQAPHLLPKSREGFKYGDTALVDSMAYDALYDQFTDQAMINLTESCNAVGAHLTREEQDAFAAQSHQRAALAWKNGVFDDEVVPVTIPSRKGDLTVAEDEGIRGDTTVETLAGLRPVSKDGTITAGSASQISDGAAAVVVMSRAKAEELGLTWLAEVGASGQVAGPDSTLQLQPARAIEQAAAKEGIAVSDIDLFELNEAFAAVGIESARQLGVSQDVVNVNGGAIALGHPVGMSGTRIVLHLALELKRRGGGVGAAALCGGGGQGDALIIRVPASVRRRSSGNVPELVERAREGDARAVARLISLVEDASPLLREVMAGLAPYAGNAHVVGITGSPGVGKSTSTNALVGALRQADRRVGVLAVDPSSPFSGGALLGDRVRMQDHALDRDVYIRSMASRGHLGGLSWTTPQALRVLDAAGCDVILVETVGVGQSEVEIAGLADTTLVLMAPGMGDGIQAAKAGILEIGDVYVINKADRDGADQVRRELRSMLALAERPEGAWRPPIVKTVASRGEGVAEVVEEIGRHHGWLVESGQLAERRTRRARDEIEAIAVTALRARWGDVHGRSELDDLAAAVAAGDSDPYVAADELLETFTD